MNNIKYKKYIIHVTKNVLLNWNDVFFLSEVTYLRLTKPGHSRKERICMCVGMLNINLLSDDTAGVSSVTEVTFHFEILDRTSR